MYGNTFFVTMCGVLSLVHDLSLDATMPEWAFLFVAWFQHFSMQCFMLRINSSIIVRLENVLNTSALNKYSANFLLYS